MFIPTETVTDQKSFLGHAILHCIKPEKFDFTKSNEKGGVNVSFQIEGEEADLQSFMDNVESQIERMVEEKAAELIKQKAQPIMDALFRLENGAESLVKVLDEKQIW